MGAKKTLRNDTQNDGKSGSYLVRQDRIPCDPDRHTLVFDGNKIANVVNISPFGLALESKEPLPKKIQDAVFMVDKFPVSQVSLEAVRESQDFGVFSVAYSVIGDPVDIEASLFIKELNQVLDSNKNKFLKETEINDQFRLTTLEIKEVLYNLQDHVNSMSLDSFTSDLARVNHFEDTVANRVSGYLSEHLTPMYVLLKKAVDKLPKELLPMHFEYFRKTVGAIIFQSAYAHRAYVKPSGYAGDFEMMNHVYKRELRGTSLFAKCLQRYFVDEPAGRAVRNREIYLRKKIKEIVNNNPGKKIKVMSVACGPAVEIQNLVADESFPIECLEIHLLDQDQDALKFAQRRIAETGRAKKRSLNLVLHHINIKQVINTGLSVKDFDLVYSAGLFDYFTDPVASFAAKQLLNSVKNGGSLVIGNFSVNNPNHFAMGLIMDWNLIYRSAQKMEELFAPIGSKYKLEQEEQGINLFANIIR